jgi:hypothetical protein
VRNVLLGLGLVIATLIAASRLLGWAYSLAAPWSTGLFVDPVDAPTDPPAMAWPKYPPGTWIAVGGLFVVAFIAWVASGSRVGKHARPAGSAGQQLKWRPRLERLAAGVAVYGCAVALVVVGGPALARMAAHVYSVDSDLTVAGVGSTAGVLTAATTLWNMLGSRGEPSPTSRPSRLRRLFTGAGFAARGLVSIAVIVILLGLALFIAGLGLSAAAVEYLPREAGGDGLKLWTDPYLLWTVIPLAVLSIVFDQTRMSLHPFYKRRLATAFGLYRKSPGRAEERPWETLTSLRTFGASPDGKGPELLLCAAASVSGQGVVPPGRKVTPFVFNHRYVGGPALGYLDTGELERILAGRTYGSDLTVLSAMAISGAAFASAMGRMSGPFNVLLSLSNTRLGVWLPNPRYLTRRVNARHDPKTPEGSAQPPFERWRAPLPWVRRLTYYARELIGSYPLDERFVYVSDGGHYENLGLVELLRRRCGEIYCVDASGDSSIAQTLAEAATLAYEELGVRIEVEGLPLAPRSAQPGSALNRQLRDLELRFADRAVVAGKIYYPAEAGAAPAPAKLIVGKAVLTASLPYALRAYAVRARQFPGDTTADQWFDVSQFDGRRLPIMSRTGARHRHPLRQAGRRRR